MGKRRKGHKQKAAPVYGSDDERAYASEKVPDAQGDDFYNDEVDTFHADRNKILLDTGAKIEPAGFSSDEEDVLGISGSEDSEIEEYEKKLQHFKSVGFKDTLASDIEDESDEEEDDGRWGSNKRKYYDADNTEVKNIDLHHDGLDAAVLEEEEAMLIQKKMQAQLDEADIGLDIFKTTKKPAEQKEEKEIKVSKDLSKMSKKEKLQLLRKESPELFDLVEDYKVRMSELCDKLLPIHNRITSGEIPMSSGSKYVQTKVRLYLNYCVNISFYMTLKAKHAPVQNHPVITRLVQYRNLLKEMDAIKDRVDPEIESLLAKIENGEQLKFKAAKRPTFIQRKRAKAAAKESTEKRKLSEMVSESEEETEQDSSLPVGGRSWGRKRKKDEEQYNAEAQDEGDGLVGGDDEEDEEGKRGITYDIEKNKGLMPKRKKEQRNPRVKYRKKYRKAVIRRKGQVREVKTETERYGGEMSGIRAGIKKSVKFK